MRRRAALLAGVCVIAAAVSITGCGATPGGTGRDASESAIDHLVPIPTGRGPRFQLRPRATAVRQGRPVHGLRCLTGRATPEVAHVEVFARGLVLPLPPGIGIAPPVRRDGAYVAGGRCWYAVRTREPTGLLELEPRAHVTLGDLFALWGQRLAPDRLASFRGPVRAYVDGTRQPGDPADVPIRPRAVLVLEVGAYVRPHTHYVYPPGR